MLNAGFTFCDIEKLYKYYDIRTFNTFIIEALKYDKKQKLIKKRDTAEAFNMAYVGSKPSKGEKSQREYSKWQRKIIKEIAKLESRKIQQETVWQRLRGKGKRKSRRF